MLEYKKYLKSSTIFIVLVAMCLMLTGFNLTVYGSSNDNDSCYNSGVTDGQDHPFDQNKYDECGSAYYDGFLSGCMSVQGNDHETCESTTD